MRSAILVLFCAAPLLSPAQERIPPGASAALPPLWTDHDSEEAADALVNDLAAGRWRHPRKGGRLMVRLLPIGNRSTHHLNGSAITTPLRRRLTRLRGIQLTTQRSGRADLLLAGFIQAQDDAVKGKELNTPTLCLQLVDLRSGELLWARTHAVRRLIEHLPPAKARRPLKVRRLGPDERLDLSGYFNDSDARAIASAAARALRQSAWLAGQHPVLQVSYVTNRTGERIDARLVAAYLSESLLALDKVRLLADSEFLAPAKKHRLSATHVLDTVITAERAAKKQRYEARVSLHAVGSRAPAWSFTKAFAKRIKLTRADTDW